MTDKDAVMAAVEKLNEDSFYITEDQFSKNQIFILADGMGGCNAGDVASKLATTCAKNYIENNFENTQIEMIDCVEYVNKAFNKITTKAYEEFAKKAPEIWGFMYKQSERGPIAKISSDSNKLMELNKILQEFIPDYVISTHPFSSQMCAYLKKKGKANFKLATILTDYAPHDQWLLYPEYVDYFFVAHSGMREQLLLKGIDSTKVFATGIPLSNRFLKQYDKNEILKEFNLDDSKKTVLFFAGGEFGLGKNTTLEILKTFAEDFKDLQIVAIAGRNKSMKEHFEQIVKESSREDSIKVLDYINMVPELMSISSAVVTKPGGLTTTESLASGLPIIVINPIPGQEEENAEFLEKNGVAIWIKKDDNIKEVLTDIFSNPDKMKEMKIRARLLAKKNSTQDICKIILDL